MIGKLLTHGNFRRKTFQMAKNLYKAKFENKLPFGGIATGHINLGPDGEISGVHPSFFAIKAEKDGELYDARMLQSRQNIKTLLPCLESASSSAFFPFAEICFSDPSFPADVKLKAFSPFIPLNDTDSGIPAVCFEFEVTNKNTERLDFSIACVYENINENSFNRMGCTDTGEAYIFLSVMQQDDKNTCIATNGKNISFCEYTSCDDFADNFKNVGTLYNKTRSECEDFFAAGAICTHFSLGENESATVKFCISWDNPKNEFSRNYYAQYFESSLECCSYLFRQMERLEGSSKEFCDSIFGATVPRKMLDDVNRDLFDFISRDYLRLDDGTLRSNEKTSFSDIDSFISRSGIMASLFPALEYSEVEHFYKSALYENADDTEITLAILRSYRKFILSADTDSLIEDWYYISKCMEHLFGEDCKKKPNTDNYLIGALIEAVAKMAQVVKDKKRLESYSVMLNELPTVQSHINITEGFARLYEISGFEYKAEEKYIGFSPDSDSCPLDDGGTFRCFFCTPTCYGYVEEGIDYIEINLLCGVLTIRSFGVPRLPRLAQYGGRNWRFENRNLTCVLDSDLEITPHKKLTILIDIKQ